MKCEKCGYLLSTDWNVCPKCSKVINDKDVETQNEQLPIDTEIIQKPNDEIDTKEENPEKYRSGDTEKILIVVFLISFILPPFIVITASIGANPDINILIQNLSHMVVISNLIALISIVTAHIKFPKNRIIKVLFWIYISFIVLAAIIIIILAIACVNTCTSMMCQECESTCLSCQRFAEGVNYVQYKILSFRYDDSLNICS